MKKVLFTSHLANFAKFNYPFMKWFQDQGWEVHYASLNEEEILCCDRSFAVCFNRSPYSPDNVTAYHQLKEIIEREDYDMIHCHTPMGGVVTRLAARKARKRGAKVIYTAHGFHFYKGAPALNWMLYYPVEKLLAGWTDCLVVINQEDYHTATTKQFRAGRIRKVDGVGVDLSKFCPVTQEKKDQLRQGYGYGKEAFILLCVAEFTDNKNQKFLIQSLSKLSGKIPGIRLIFAGKGKRLDACKNLAKALRITSFISFLGYRDDIPRLCQLSDVMVSSSSREGLPLNVIEGMASGLPIVCSKIRGQTDLVCQGVNGFLYPKHDADAFVESILLLYNDAVLRQKMGAASIEEAKQYDLNSVLGQMGELYQQIFSGKDNR